MSTTKSSNWFKFVKQNQQSCWPFSHDNAHDIAWFPHGWMSPFGSWSWFKVLALRLPSAQTVPPTSSVPRVQAWRPWAQKGWQLGGALWPMNFHLKGRKYYYFTEGGELKSKLPGKCSGKIGVLQGICQFFFVNYLDVSCQSLGMLQGVTRPAPHHWWRQMLRCHPCDAEHLKQRPDSRGYDKLWMASARHLEHGKV